MAVVVNILVKRTLAWLSVPRPLLLGQQFCLGAFSIPVLPLSVTSRPTGNHGLCNTPGILPYNIYLLKMKCFPPHFEVEFKT